MSNIDPLSSRPSPSPERDQGTASKPVGQPQSDKNFAQIQENSRREQSKRKQQTGQEKKEPEEGVTNKPAEAAPKKSSLFDLSQTQRKPPEEGEKQPFATAGKPTSEAEQAGQQQAGQAIKEGKPAIGTPPTQAQLQQQMIGKEGAMRSETGKGEGAQEVSLKKDSVTDKSEGRPELAALDQQSKQNPFAETSTQIDSKVGKEEAAKPSSTIQQIADKIVEKLQTVQTGDKIDTTITLKSPPMLEGASITITSSASAKGEISLAFSNLSPEGKALIDQNTASLKLALEKNGYTVHDVVSVPKEIQAAPLSSEGASKDQQREGEKDRGGGGGGREGGGREGGAGGGKGQQQQQRNR